MAIYEQCCVIIIVSGRLIICDDINIIYGMLVCRNKSSNFRKHAMVLYLQTIVNLAKQIYFLLIFDITDISNNKCLSKIISYYIIR